MGDYMIKRIFKVLITSIIILIIGIVISLGVNILAEVAPILTLILGTVLIVYLGYELTR